jgi:hypothetical protein
MPGEGPLSYFILGFAAFCYFGKRAWANRKKLPKIGRFIRKPESGGRLEVHRSTPVKKRETDRGY